MLAGSYATKCKLIDGTGPKAGFYYPSGLTIDQKTGTIFVSDSSNHAIRKVSMGGKFDESNNEIKSKNY